MEQKDLNSLYDLPVFLYFDDNSILLATPEILPFGYELSSDTLLQLDSRNFIRIRMLNIKTKIHKSTYI